MSSINNSFASAVPIEKSERNEYCCVSEQELERLLTEAIEKKMVEGAQKTKSKSSATIYRVPEEIRKLKTSAYTPRLVSIGPLHSKDQHILESPAQDVKRSYANSLFGRISSSKGVGSEEEPKSITVLLMECVGQMRKSLDKAKKCYAEEVGEVLNEEMLVIDGCFILELLYRSYHMDIDKSSSDPIFGCILTTVYIRHDLLLLENQLPFFVLRKLFALTVARITPGHSTLRDYVISYFHRTRMWKSERHGKTTTKKSRKVEGNYDHILHILHGHYHPDNDNNAVAQRDGRINKFMPCASDLEYAGVKFVVGTKVRFSPSGLFHKAHFEIPTLHIYDHTEPFLRNLIAFEQCCHGDVVKRYFTSYAVLMDTLINTPKDIRVLEKADIIHNHLGASEDASDLFNNLCKGVVLGKFYFAETVTAAALYSKRCCADNMADLKRQYFANPWTFIAFCAGFITFGITLLRFIRSDFHR